jgi:O-antigen/teichoic acid export membrane protein
MIESVKNLYIKFEDHIFTQGANAIFMVAGIAIHIFLTRVVFSLDDYGVFNGMLSLLGTLSLIFCTGLPLYLTRKISREESSQAHGVAVVVFDLILSFIVSIFLIVFSKQIDNSLSKNVSIEGYLPYFLIILPAYTVNSFIQSFLGGKRRFKEQAILSAMTSIIKAVFAILFGYYFGIVGALIAYASQGYIMLVYFLLRNIKKINISVTQVAAQVKKIAFSGEMWHVATMITVYSVLTNFLLTRDLFLVENYAFKDYGLYSAMTTLARIPVYPLLSLGVIFFPNYSRKGLSLADSKKRFIRDILFEIGFAIPMVLVYFLFGGFAMELLFKLSPANASLILGLIAISSASFAIFSLIATKVQAMGFQTSSVVAVVLSLLILFSAGPYLIQNYGLIGASLNILAATLPSSIVIIIAVLFKQQPSENTLQS